MAKYDPLNPGNLFRSSAFYTCAACAPAGAAVTAVFAKEAINMLSAGNIAGTVVSAVATFAAAYNAVRLLYRHGPKIL